MEKNKTILKPLLLLTLVVMVLSNPITAKAHYEAVGWDKMTGGMDKKNNVTISEDGTHLVIDKPVLAWSERSEPGYYTKDFINFWFYSKTDDHSVGDTTYKQTSKRTIRHFYEIEMYDAKTNKLLQKNECWELRGSKYGESYSGMKLGVDGMVGFEVTKKAQKKPFYVRMRTTAYDSNTGLSGTSEWSAPLYYVPAVKMNKSVKTSNSAKISWKKLNIKGVKNYTIYIKRYKTEKQLLNNSWVKVATTKKTNYTIKKFKKSNLNFKKYDYAVKVVANMKFKGKTRQTPEVMCNMKYLK